MNPRTTPRRAALAVVLTVQAALAMLSPATSSAATTTGMGTQTPPGDVSWLAAGDSYSSGEGIPGTGGPDDPCARSMRAYGPRAAGILRKTDDWTISPLTFTACTGALIGDFYRPQPGKGVRPRTRPPRDPAAPPDTTTSSPCPLAATT